MLWLPFVRDTFFSTLPVAGSITWHCGGNAILLHAALRQKIPYVQLSARMARTIGSLPAGMTETSFSSESTPRSPYRQSGWRYTRCLPRSPYPTGYAPPAPTRAASACRPKSAPPVKTAAEGVYPPLPRTGACERGSPPDTRQAAVPPYQSGRRTPAVSSAM